jgi:hypothetical protein
VPGFNLVGEQDALEDIYTEIPQVIAALAEADFGHRVLVRLEKTHSEYVENLPESFKPGVSHYSIERLAA